MAPRACHMAGPPKVTTRSRAAVGWPDTSVSPAGVRPKRPSSLWVKRPWAASARMTWRRGTGWTPTLPASSSVVRGPSASRSGTPRSVTAYSGRARTVDIIRPRTGRWGGAAGEQGRGRGDADEGGGPPRCQAGQAPHLPGGGDGQRGGCGGDPQVAGQGQLQPAAQAEPVDECHHELADGLEVVQRRPAPLGGGRREAPPGGHRLEVETRSPVVA